MSVIIIYLVFALVIGALQFLNKNKAASRLMSGLFLCAQWLLAWHACTSVGAAEGLFFRYDGLGVAMTAVLTVVATASFIHSSRYITRNDNADEGAMRGQYAGAMVFLTMALTMANLSSHIAVTWIFVELTTLSASALIFYRRNAGSIEATWKYVFACSISLLLVYVGILFFSVAMGERAETGLSYDRLVASAPQLDAFWLKMAFVFIFVGYTAKMSLVPMFTAGIDAKDKAPTPAAAMLSSVVMNVGFVGFYRVYAVVSHTAVKPWADMVILVTGLASIFVAAVYLVRVGNVKRLFAYSSVEHMGVVMIGIAAGGIGVYAAILHLVLHTFAKSAIFLHIGHFYRVFGTKDLSRMGRYYRYSGVGTVFVLAALLCVTAMPPSGLFVTELMVFRSLVDCGYWVPLALALVLLTVIVWAISRDMLSLLFLPPQVPESVRPNSVPAPWYETVWQFLLLALAIWLGFDTPQFVADLLGDAVGMVS